MPVTVSGASCTLAGGVQETTQTVGTGTYELDGGVTDRRSFVEALGSGVTTIYTARLGDEFESGIGVATAGSPATLTRAIILESSNGGSPVDWDAGVKDIFCDVPAAVLHSLQAQLSTGPALFGPTSLSGSQFNFTSVPDTASKIEIMFDGLRASAASTLSLTLGDSGGLETSGYDGRLLTLEESGFGLSATLFNHSSNFRIHSNDGNVRILNGVLILDRLSNAVHRWSLTGRLDDEVLTCLPTGLKTLSAVMTQFRVTTSAGSFNNGAISTRIWS